MKKLIASIALLAFFSYNVGAVGLTSIQLHKKQLIELAE